MKVFEVLNVGVEVPGMQGLIIGLLGLHRNVPRNLADFHRPEGPMHSH